MNRLYLILGIILTGSLLTGCGESNADSSDPVIGVEANDPAMLAAFAQARRETNAFLAVMNSGTADSCSVKVKMEDHGQVEYFWLANLTYADGVFKGEIDNDPELVKNVKIGQKVEVKKDGIFDWLYMKNGKMYGNYTVRVLIPKMTREDADKIRAMLAD